jgi:hypothetical protein
VPILLKLTEGLSDESEIGNKPDLHQAFRMRFEAVFMMPWSYALPRVVRKEALLQLEVASEIRKRKTA